MIADRQHLMHGTCVSLAETATVLRGAPGSGKSDLALRFVTECADRGARLIGDDQLVLERRADTIWAAAAPGLAGKLEVRGVGIVPIDHQPEAAVVMIVDLVGGDAVPRMPPDPPPVESLLGVDVPVFRLFPFEASAPAKLLLLLSAAGGQSAC